MVDTESVPLGGESLASATQWGGGGGGGSGGSGGFSVH